MAPTATRDGSNSKKSNDDAGPKSSPKNNDGSTASPSPQKLSTGAAASAKAKQAASNNEQGAPSSQSNSSKQTTSNDQESTSQMKPFLSSLQSYVTAQVGARLDTIMAEQYHRKTSGISRDALQSEAEEVFPFLRNVNWFLERQERMEQSQRVIEARQQYDTLNGDHEALSDVVFEGSDGALAGTNDTNETAAKSSTDLGRKATQTRSRQMQAAASESDDSDDDDKEEEEVAGLKQPPETLAASGKGENATTTSERSARRARLGLSTQSSAAKAAYARRSPATTTNNGTFEISSTKKKNERGAKLCMAVGCKKNAQSNTRIDDTTGFCRAHYNEWLIHTGKIDSWDCECGRKVSAESDRCGMCHRWRGGGPSSEAVAGKKRKASSTLPPKKRALPVEPQSDSEESYQPGIDDSDSDTLRPSKKYQKKNPGDKATPGPPRPKTSFAERINQCREYKQKHGHLRIPRNEREHNLGTFAQSMRVNYQKFFSGELPVVKKGGRSNRKTVGIQLEMLEEIAFPFDYARMNGVRDAVIAEATAGEISLARWTESNLAAAATNGRGAVWEYYLDLARHFKEEHGHLNVPKHNEIGAWADRMRGLYNQRLQGKASAPLTTVEKEKIQILEGMGFAFDKAFDVNLQKFIAYKESTGKTKVPCTYKPDRALGSWAEMVRREHGKMNKGEASEYLTSDRLRKLAGAGFTFRSKPREIPWEERLEMLRVYKAEHDGNDPPSSHPTMGNWIMKIRQYYNRRMDGKKTHLSDERIEQLHNLGFVFQKGARPSMEHKARSKEGMKITWDDRLQEFIRWKEKHGHPYVPTVCHNEDKHLGRWVAKQRMAYKSYQAGKVLNSKYGMLTAEKALKLANAGFAFEASHIRRTPKDDVGDSKILEAAGHDDDDEEEEMERNHEEEVAPEDWNAFMQLCSNNKPLS